MLHYMYNSHVKNCTYNNNNNDNNNNKIIMKTLTMR